MTFVSAGKNLDMIMNFRSSDVFLGLPYDIIVGALMLKYIANATGHVSKNIFFNLANAHIYENHLNEVNEMLLLNTYPDPTLKVNKFSFNAEDYIIENYQSNKFIKAELNV